MPPSSLSPASQRPLLIALWGGLILVAASSILLFFASLTGLFSNTLAAALTEPPPGSSPTALTTMARLLVMATTTAFASAVFTAAFMVYRRPADPMVLFTAIYIILSAIYTLRPSAAAADALPFWARTLHLFVATGAAALAPTYWLLFPTGRPFPQWSVWGIAAWVTWLAFTYTLPNIAALPTSETWQARNQISIPLVFFVIGLSLAAQVFRFFTHASPAQRQQTKWVLLAGLVAAAFSLFISLNTRLLPAILQLNPVQTYFVNQFAPVLFLQVAVAVLAFALAFATLRLRLWEVDRLLNRTIVYALLILTLSFFYIGASALSHNLLAPLLPTPPDLLDAAVATLTILLIANPLHDALQRAVDQLFFRNQANLRAALIAFTSDLQTLIDLPDIYTLITHRAADLIGAVCSAIYLLDPHNQFQPAHGFRLTPIPPLTLTHTQRQRLISGVPLQLATGQTFQLLIPLVALRTPADTAPTLFGLLAIGERYTRRGYTPDDINLLTSLADQSANAIQVARLIADREAETQRVEVAEAASRAKSAFLASMSHELRTPLNAIIGYSEMLIKEFDDLGDPQLQSYIPDLHRISTAGQIQLELVNHILELSKIEASKLQIIASPCQLRPLLEDLADTLQPLSDQHNILFTIQAPFNLPTLHTDADILNRLLYNVLKHALTTAPNGRVTLQISRITSVDLLIKVTDTGPGLTPEELDIIFNPFQLVQLSYLTPGAGLGLALARQYAELLQAQFTVRTRTGHGSTYTLTLPLNYHTTLAPAAADNRTL